MIQRIVFFAAMTILVATPGRVEARTKHRHSKKSHRKGRSKRKRQSNTKTKGARHESMKKRQGKRAEKASARKLFALGAKQYEAGHIRKALGLFKDAYLHWDNPRILLNIAICHLELDEIVEAVSILRQGLARMTPRQRALFRAKLPPKLLKADKGAATLFVNFTTGKEPHLRIYLDGRDLGPVPVSHVILPGKHLVEIRSDKGGKTMARKEIIAKPGATVSWVAKAPGWISCDIPKPPKKSRWKKLQRLPIWYFGAAALITVVAGGTLIGLGVKTNALEDDYFAHPTRDTHDKGIAYRRATNTMIGVTATAALATGVLALFTNWKHPFGSSEHNLSILPTPGPSGGTITLSGSF